MRFRDTGCLNNATPIERSYTIALSMYCKLGCLDPSDKYIWICRNKDIIPLYKTISKERITATNTLYKVNGYTINKHMKLNKIKNDKTNKNKSNNS